MFKRKRHYHHHHRLSRKKKWSLTVVSVVLLAGGGYLLFLTLAPSRVLTPLVPSAIDLNTDDDKQDKRNRIQIERINLEVPYFAGDASTLEKGVWWRFPERGNPEKGGNFILSAHRFYIGYTPQGTRERSPFYNLEELEPGSRIRIYYNQQWYEYQVTAKYSVAPNAVEIEEPTEEPRLTLYTCTLGGSADGRVVIEAKPINRN